MKAAPGQQDPVPFMSASSVDCISDHLAEFDVVVEYGSGSSTRYFLRQIIDQGKECLFVSVERSPDWFDYVRNNVESDLSDTDTSEREVGIHAWSMERIHRYTRSETQTRLDIPVALRRLPAAQQRMNRGFPREILRRLFPGRRPHDGRYSVLIDGRVRFEYMLNAEPMKDQYGESPLKMDYIDAGLDPVRELLRSGSGLNVGWIVDGGPRGDVVHEILDLEEEFPNLCPSIFVLEAHRALYDGAFARRPTGDYVKGSGQMLNSELSYLEPKNPEKNTFWYGKPEITIEALLEKEMWYYCREASDG